MIEVRWSRRARRDLDAIRTYWIDERPDYWEAVLFGAAKALSFFVEIPGDGSPHTGGRRKWRIGRTPYFLLYRLDSTALVVTQVVHARQNWRRRR